MIKPSVIQQNEVVNSIDLIKNSLFLDLRGGAGTKSAPESTLEPVIESFFGERGDFARIIFAVILGTLLKPTAKFYYEQMPLVFQKFYGEAGDAKTYERENQCFDETRFYHIVQTLVEAARLLIVVEVFDILMTGIVNFGLRIPKNEKLTVVFGCGLYLLWGSRRLSRFKLYTLKKIMKNTDFIDDRRRVHVIHRLSDYVLLFFGIFIFYEILNIEMGYSAKSLLGVISLFTAAIALATKDIITNFLNGVILSASDRIHVGDFISIQGEIKKVKRLGWLETALTGSDNTLYTVPNTELLSTNLSNLSRVNTSQGKAFVFCLNIGLFRDFISSICASADISFC